MVYQKFLISRIQIKRTNEIHDVLYVKGKGNLLIKVGYEKDNVLRKNIRFKNMSKCEIKCNFK